MHSSGLWRSVACSLCEPNKLLPVYKPLIDTFFLSLYLFAWMLYEAGRIFSMSSHSMWFHCWTVCCIEKKPPFAVFILPHADLIDFILFLLGETVNNFLLTFCKLMRILVITHFSRFWRVLLCLNALYVQSALCLWLYLSFSLWVHSGCPESVIV